jgi:alkylation response protein AidB-like acyl-CoA dehydrogenase
VKKAGRTIGGPVEFSWSDEDDRFRHELRDFIDSELPPRWTDLIPGEEPASEFIRDFCGKLGQRGWLTPHWPSQYGGSDGSPWQFIILGEELWGAGEPRGSQYMNVNWIGPAIINAGTPEQKSYHLRRISAGDVFWCQGFSETEAGTDLANMRTAAERDGDDYVINGEKVWTSYAAEADFCFLLARTDPNSTGNKGISIFLVPTGTPGFTIEPIPSVLDIHEFNRLTFTNVRVPVSARLGPENAGWQVVREALSHERIGGPRYARAARVTERLREMARSRGWWDRDGIKSRLAEADASCEAARLLVYQAIHARSRGRSEDLEVSLARVAIVRCERIVAEVALEMFEDESLELGSIANSQLKTSMIAGLGGGSVEVQLNGIARALLGPAER